MISLVPAAAAIYARSVLATCLRGGYLGLQGLVYGGADVTSEPGFVKIDYLDRPLPPNLRAIAGAEIAIDPSPSDGQDERAQNAPATVRVTSARDGHFIASTLIPGPRRREFTVHVSAPGFASVECRFRQERVMHSAVIVMARRPTHGEAAS
jgi:hypothetical protein